MNVKGVKYANLVAVAVEAIKAPESEQAQALSALIEYLTRSTHVRLADS